MMFQPWIGRKVGKEVQHVALTAIVMEDRI